MRFSIFHYLIALWVCWRLIVPLRISSKSKKGLIALVVVVMSFSTVTTLFFGGLISPQAPQWFLIVGNWAAWSITILAVFVLLREVLVFFGVLAGRSGEKFLAWVKENPKTASGLAATAMTVTGYGVYKGVEVPVVRERDLYFKNLPRGLENLRIVQISDLHASALLKGPHIQAIVEKVNALKPDLILVTGDMVDGTVPQRLEDVLPYKALKARYGVIACEGNHEHYCDYPGWMKTFPELGLPILRNEHKVLTINGETLVIAGVRDPWGLRFNRPAPDPIKAFEGAPGEKEGVFRILLSHQPKPVKKYVKDVQVDLVLSGHTHGGQILGMDEGVKVLNGGFVHGMYKLGRTQLFVHPGTGLWNGFPVRIGVPAEITVLVLHKAEHVLKSTD